jgi:ubiquinone/menaquinone biosynthesis C-methylase UbiE
VSSTEAEQHRVSSAYQKRTDAQWFGFDGLAHARRVYNRYLSTLRLLDDLDLRDLSQLNVLDAGCGTGDLLLALLHWGANGERTVGVDLRADAVETAKVRLPNVAVHCADLREMPVDSSSINLIFLNTVLSSVQDKSIRSEILEELRRVACPGATVIVYDVIRRNPSNKDLYPISKTELQNLAGAHKDFSSKIISLAPPIARHIPRSLFRTHDLLEAFPFLCTHRLTSFKLSK